VLADWPPIEEECTSEDWLTSEDREQSELPELEHLPLDVERMPEDRLTSELEDLPTREEWPLPLGVEESLLQELLDSEPIVQDLLPGDALPNSEPSESVELELDKLES